jgi:hypothetical protein
MPTTSVNTLSSNNRGFSLFEDRKWSRIERQLVQITGEDDGSTLSLFRTLHDAGIDSEVLLSVAHLSSITRIDYNTRDEHVGSLARFFASSSVSFSTKLGCLRTLMVLVSPIDAAWQLEEDCLKETLGFLVDRRQDWTFPQHSESMLLCELRAKCLRHQEVCLRQVQHVVQGSDLAAAYIADAATLVEQGLQWSVPFIHVGLEAAGDTIKSVMTPSQESPPQTKVVATCASAARRASDSVRETAMWTAIGIRDASASGIQMAAKTMEPLGAKLIPDNDHRQVLQGVGKVGVATVGAVAIVGEAVFETTKSVAQKTAAVTADVVRYKYGESAGNIVQDASATTGNVIRTLTHVAMLEGTIMTKAVAKHASREQLRPRHEEKKDEHAPDDDPLLKLDSTKNEAKAAVEKLEQRWTKSRNRRKLFKSGSSPTATKPQVSQL